MTNYLTIYIDSIENYEPEVQQDLLENAFYSDVSKDHYLYKLVVSPDQVELHDTVGRMIPIGLEAMQEMARSFMAVDSMLHKQEVMKREYIQWADRLFDKLGGSFHVEG